MCVRFSVAGMLLLAFFDMAAAFSSQGAWIGLLHWPCTSMCMTRTQLSQTKCTATVRMSAGGDIDSVDAVSRDSLDAQRKAAKNAFITAARAGPKNGVYATAEQRADIEGKLLELIQYNPTPQPAYALLRPPFQYFSGTFALIYTNTSGGFSGKLGPLVGDVRQTFEGMRDSDAMGLQRRGVFGGGGLFGGRKPGCILSNTVNFGELGISLRARCESKTDTKLSIHFEELSVSLFGAHAPFSKTFEEGGRGTRWTLELTYMDEEFRVLRTNRGNVLALVKV